MPIDGIFPENNFERMTTDMEMRKRIVTGALCGALLVGTAVPALAATVHYNDGASVGGSTE